MSINLSNLIIDENSEFYENKWIPNSSEEIEDDRYNVYQGTGEYSLIKLLIKEEITLETQTI